MMTNNRLAITAAATMAALAMPAPASAQDEDPVRANAAQVTLYGWLSGYGGDIRPGATAPTSSVDKSFGELFKDLDAAFFASAFVRRGAVVFLADISHSSSSKQGLVPTFRPAPFPPSLPAEGRLSQTSLTALAGYRVAENGQTTLDLMGGVRAWRLRPAIEVPALGVSREGEVGFVDPIIAARARFGVAPRLSAIVYADVGGFGAGSDDSFQMLATLNARVGERIWLSGGYRYLAVDYEDRGGKVDSRLGGPLLGVTAAF